MNKSPKQSRMHREFMMHKMLREAPPLVNEPAATALPPAANQSEEPATTSTDTGAEPIATTPTPTRSVPSLLAQGEEARLGKRKNKRVRGLIRGGRNSPDWPAAEEHIGAKVPAGFSQRVAELALGHRLHKWQVLVEALDCFVKKHGTHAGSKSQG
jgi:hypothetical protein